MVYCLDSSALVKLFSPELDQLALTSWYADSQVAKACSALSFTEAERALRRHCQDVGLQQSLMELDLTFDKLVILPVSQAILLAAGRLAPTTLRSLDAIHLATALTLRPDLDGLVTYDNRLAEAAQHHGIKVVQPA